MTETVKPTLNTVIVGHVDHGKSTLVGRLLHDTKSLPDGKYEAVAQVCEDTGKDFEFAFLLDALEEERDQGITIDTTQIRFHTDKRDYVIIDAPGHKEFLKNMVTGAASAEVAILLIDADEGIQEQSRRHGYILHLLGMRQVTIVINKMDLVEYSQAVYDEIRTDYLAFLRQLDIVPQFVVPLSAREGDNVARRSENMPWYDGPTILEALDMFDSAVSKESGPLRMPIQDVYKFDKRRIVAGRVESGSIKEGDTIRFSPSGHKAVVKSVERWQDTRNGGASAGESIGITLNEQLFIERGDIISHLDDAPKSSGVLEGNIFWLGDQHLTLSKKYVLKLTTQEVECTIASISGVINTASLAKVGDVAREVAKNEVATVVFDLKSSVAFDPVTDVVETGRFVLVDGYDVSGGGIIVREHSGENYQI
jgi:bifunctional enzyme CysN/CysC